LNRKVRIGAIACAVVLGVIMVFWLLRPTAPTASQAGVASAPSALTVDLVTPRTETWPQTVHAGGPVAAWQEIIVSPEIGGLRIAELRVDVGEHVTRGQVLAQLADESLRAELRKQEAALAQAQANLEQAESNSRRAQMVAGSGALSDQQIEQYHITEATARATLASARAELDATKLKVKQTRVIAPDEGVVIAKSGVLGNVVNTGAELFRLLRQGRVEWQAELDARQLEGVKAGQRARVTLPSGVRVEGTVRIVAPALSTNTGRAIAYVSLPKDSPARVGMFVNGAIDMQATPAVTLPQSALVARDGRSYVYVLGEGDKASSRAVITGRRRGDRIEVLSGLEPDARIVAGGGAFLSEGAHVTVASADVSADADQRTSRSSP
jgi:RND family efflux transporter MFP subunit